MRKLLVWLAFACIVPLSATAEVDHGWGFFAAMHNKFPCGPITTYVNGVNKPYMSVLWDTFGTKKKCLKTFLSKAKNKPHTLQIYLTNETCRRWNGCQSYEFAASLGVQGMNQALEKRQRRLLKKLRKKSKQVLTWVNANKNSNTRVLITSGLEDNFSKKAAEVYIDVLKKTGWRPRDIVRNPCCGAYVGKAGANYIEYHGVRNATPANSIHSLDGTRPNICKVDGETRITGDVVSDGQLSEWSRNLSNRNLDHQLWCAVHQGLSKDSTSVGHPRSRKPRISNRSVRRAFSVIGTPSAPPPGGGGKHNTKGCKRVKEFTAGNLVKESDHGGLVAVFTDQKKFKSVTVVSPRGKKTSLTFSGWANPIGNNERQHWRHTKAWSTFANNSVFKAVKKKGFRRTKICWKAYRAGDRHG